MEEKSASVSGTEKATFGGGCFWCTEAVFSEVKGVLSVVSGYAGGTVPNPSYELVCSDTTGHAEVIQVEFQPSVITYEQLLEIFFLTHDPTTPDQQGADFGRQYRSIVLYHDEGQKAKAEQMISKLGAEGVFEDPIITEVVPLTVFYPAEDYHQGYYKNNPKKPYCRIVINPKLSKFRKGFSDKISTTP